MNRREFIGRFAGTVAVMSSFVSRTPRVQAVAVSDRVNVGLIGVGSRGQEVIRTMLRVPGVHIQGLCDVYEPRFAMGHKITGEKTPVYTDYRKLLEARDLDAIVVATPLSLHAEHVVAALESGRHVYGEKSLALTVPECDRIVQAVKRTGKRFQIGAQYHYAPWFREALKRVRAGKLGKITQIYAYWHRHNNWRRPVPDPKDPKLERLINWRLYRATSGGLLAELGSHYITFANEVFGGIPESVVGSGGIDFWKDGREIPDNIQVVFRYPTGQTMFFSAITTNILDGSQVRVLGTEGSAMLTQANGTFYDEPSRARPVVSEERITDHGVPTGATFHAEMPYLGKGQPIEIPRGPDGNATFVACRSFVESVRNNQRPEADEVSGWESGIAVALGNHAIDTGERVRFAQHVKVPL